MTRRLKILCLLLLVVPALQLTGAVLPAAPLEIARADHLNTGCTTNYQCGSELMVTVVDDAGNDASGDVTQITWRRDQATNCIGCDGIDLEFDSGTLVAHNEHFHSLLALFVQGDGTGFNCDFGARNEIVFSINGQANVASTNICRDWTFVRNVTLTLPRSPGGSETGSVEIIVNDINELLQELQTGAISCTLTKTAPADGTIYDCFDLLTEADSSAPRAIVSGTSIVFFNIEEGSYSTILSYEEHCVSPSCADRELLTFRDEPIGFTVQPGETTQVEVTVAAFAPLSDSPNDGTVPKPPPEFDLPCKPAERNNPLEWIVCPIVNGLFLGLDYFYTHLIIPLLEINPLEGNGDPQSASGTLFGIWNNFRIISNVLFVAAFLLAIFGQALGGFRAFSAYNVRKILPRAILGVIGIQLSWYIVAFMVDAFNVLGAGVRGLVLAPVDGLQINGDLDLANAWGEILILIGVAGAPLIAYWVGGLIMGIPLVLFPIFFGLILTFVTVLARRILVMLLVVTAPIAFVAWILPNTAGFFKTWWSWFWKALVVYPLIILFISAGELFSKITWAGNATGDGQEQAGAATALLALIALFAPYFFIPLAFRFAGSAIAEVANGLDRQGKNLNRRFFGDRVDPGSYRGRRRIKQMTTRGRRKKRIGHIAGKMGDSKIAPVRWAGKAAAYGNALAGGGAVRRNAQELQADREWALTLTSTGRDEQLRAVLGDYSIQSGKRFSDEAINWAKPHRDDWSKIQVALEYEISRGNEKGTLAQVYSRFVHGKYGDETERNYSGKMKGYEKKLAFEQATDRLQGMYNTWKYHDPNNPEQLKTDPADLNRMVLEQTHRRSGLEDSRNQLEQYWGDMHQLSDHLRGLYEGAGGRYDPIADNPFGSSGYDPKKLSDQERELMSNATLLRNSWANAPDAGGSATSYRRRRDAINSMAFLDDEKIPKAIPETYNPEVT